MAAELAPEELESWVYAEDTVEKTLASSDYLDLLDLDYKRSSALQKAKNILAKYIDTEKYYEWELRRILQQIIDRTPAAHIYIEQCYSMYCNGYGFLDNIGLGYGLQIATPYPVAGNMNDGWDELSPSVQKGLMDSFYPDVRIEAEKVLSWLDLGKVTLTGYDAANMVIQYQDNRSNDEKKPTSYKIADESKTHPKKRTG